MHSSAPWICKYILKQYNTEYSRRRSEISSNSASVLSQQPKSFVTAPANLSRRQKTTWYQMTPLECPRTYGNITLTDLSISMKIILCPMYSTALTCWEISTSGNRCSWNCATPPPFMDSVFLPYLCLGSFSTILRGGSGSCTTPSWCNHLKKVTGIGIWKGARVLDITRSGGMPHTTRTLIPRSGWQRGLENCSCP